MILLMCFILHFFLSFFLRRRFLLYYLPSERDKLNYLLYLRRHFPSLFSGPLRFGVDFWEILDRQTRIYRRLQYQKDFRKVVRESRDYLSLAFGRLERGESFLYLDEVPPFVGIFRGPIGQDCSTLYSFPYPNDPLEKVFFIYRDPDRDHDHDQDQEISEGRGIEQKILGYASGTLVEVLGRSSFYLHTIAGEKLTGEDVRLILQGMNQSKTILGAHYLILPVGRQAGLLMNGRRIRGVFEKMVTGKQRVEISYFNEDLRQRIDETVNANYDRSSSNQYGVIFEIPGENPPIGVKMSWRDYPVFSLNDRRPPFETLRLILDFKQLGRKDSVRRLMRKGKIPKEEYDFFVREVGNQARRRVEEYKARLTDIFLRFRVEVGEDYLDRNWVYFFRGFFRAPDALAAANRRGTVSLLIRFLEGEGLKGIKEVSKFIKANRQVLLRDQTFMAYVEGLLEGNGKRGLWKFLFLINLGIFDESATRPFLENLLSDKNLKKIREDFCRKQKIGVRGQIIFKLLEAYQPLPGHYFERIETTLKFMIERGSPLHLGHFLGTMGSILKTPMARELREILQKKNAKFIQ